MDGYIYIYIVFGWIHDDPEDYILVFQMLVSAGTFTHRQRSINFVLFPGKTVRTRRDTSRLTYKLTGLLVLPVISFVIFC